MTDHTPSDAEATAGHGERRPADDRKVPWRVFAAIGGFVAVMGLIYWAAAYEESGTVMLLVAAALGLWVGGYLWLHERGPAAPEAGTGIGATTAPTTGSQAGTETAGPGTATTAPTTGSQAGTETAGPASATAGSPDTGAAAGAGGSRATAAPAGGVTEVEEAYLPHASIWPLAIGLGAAGVGVGVAVGLWVLVPGLGIMALGIGGFVRQTRRRD